MLQACPGCGKQVSRTAVKCPHCRFEVAFSNRKVRMATCKECGCKQDYDLRDRATGRWPYRLPSCENCGAGVAQPPEPWTVGTWILVFVFFGGPVLFATAVYMLTKR